MNSSQSRRRANDHPKILAIRTHSVINKLEQEFGSQRLTIFCDASPYRCPCTSTWAVRLSISREVIGC